MEEHKDDCPQAVIWACERWISIYRSVESLECDDEQYETALCAVDIAYEEYVSALKKFKEAREKDRVLHLRLVDEVAELLGNKTDDKTKN